MNRKVLSIVQVFFFAILLMSCGESSNKKEKATAKSDEATKTERIISLKGALTEVIAALGKTNDLVGVDVTSVYPAEVNRVKKVGHIRSVSAEGILSLNPTVVFADKKELKPEIASVLTKAGIKVELIEQDYSLEGSKSLIKTVGSKLNADKTEIDALTTKLDNDFAQLKTLETKPKVLFIYARGANNIMVSGTGTQMAKFIELAGAQNAVSDFEDFKPLTPESLVELNPDYILMFDSGAASLQNEESMIELPGLKETTAGKNNQIITMEGALISSFGPRLGQGLIEFQNQL